MDPIRSLAKIALTFGKGAAQQKHRLLQEILARRRCSAPLLVTLADVLDFIRAHPDNREIRALADQAARGLRERCCELIAQGSEDQLVNSGLAGSSNSHPFSFDGLRRLVKRAPGQLELDWDEMGDEGALYEILGTLVLPGESPALDDIECGLREWLERVGRVTGRTGLETVLALLEGAALGDDIRALLFETCDVPVRYQLGRPGSGRSEGRFPADRIHYQRQPVAADRWSVPERLRRPLTDVRRLAPAAARELLDEVHSHLCSRNLEIFPLTYANPRDVTLVGCGRGVTVLLAGVEPARRCALEGLYVYLILKNGVPIGYGPASPFLGCSEMGINLFDEFRGAETRFVTTQVMRVFHQLLGVECFFVTAYGMGKRNEAALASGAFWFYRKLGFTAVNPEVEALARDEKRRMVEQPGHRSDRRTLKRLANTAVTLDLSGGRCRRFDSSALAVAVTRSIDVGGGDRRRATERCTRKLVRALGIANRRAWTVAERESLRRLAPVLCLIEGLERWSARDRRALVGIIKGKAAPSETAAVAAMSDHPRLQAALRGLVEDVATDRRASPG